MDIITQIVRLFNVGMVAVVGRQSGLLTKWVPVGGKALLPASQSQNLPYLHPSANAFGHNGQGQGVQILSLSNANVNPATMTYAAILSEIKMQEGTNFPTTWGQLQLHGDTLTKILTLDEAAKAQIPIASLAASNTTNVRVLVKSEIRYNEYSYHGATVRIGSGLRWAVTISNSQSNVSTSFAVLAAQAQLNMASASVQLSEVGMTSTPIEQTFQGISTDLTVDNYVKLTEKFDAASALLLPGLAVSPEVVEVSTATAGFADSQAQEALGTCWGLARIAEQKKLSEALSAIPQNSGTTFSEAVKSVYMAFCGISGDGKPTNAQREAAKTLLNGISVKR